MDAADGAASIAISISIASSLLAGFVSMWVAMRSRQGAAVNHDRAVSILSGIALLVIVLNVSAAALIAVRGIACVGLVKAALLLTAVFAVVGMVFGLMRGLRSGRAIKTQRA
jgi:hypothetical protein